MSNYPIYKARISVGQTENEDGEIVQIEEWTDLVLDPAYIRSLASGIEFLKPNEEELSKQIAKAQQMVDTLNTRCVYEYDRDQFIVVTDKTIAPYKNKAANLDLILGELYIGPNISSELFAFDIGSMTPTANQIKERNELVKLVSKRFYDALVAFLIRPENRVLDIGIEAVPFIDKPKIIKKYTVSGAVMEIQVPFKMPPKVIGYSKVMAEHFWKKLWWGEVITKMMVATMFSASRKECKIRLKVVSNGGKGFFLDGDSSVIGHLGIDVPEKCISLLETGATSQFTSESFINVIAMICNEAKNSSLIKDLHGIDESMKVTAKYKSGRKVKTPLIILASQGEISSLDNESITNEDRNRYIILEESEYKLSDDNTFGNFYDIRHEAAEAMKAKFRDVFCEELEKYRGLKQSERVKLASSVISGYREMYKAKGTTESYVQSIIEEWIVWAVGQGSIGAEGVTGSNPYVVVAKNGRMYIHNPSRCFEDFYKSTRSVDDANQLRYAWKNDIKRSGYKFDAGFTSNGVSGRKGLDISTVVNIGVMKQIVNGASGSNIQGYQAEALFKQCLEK